MAKILLVDDDPDVVEATKIFLEKEGHTVVCATNRGDGMKAASASDIDLMILDCMMEQADDGMVMAQDLRRAGMNKPIIMLSNIGKVTGMSVGKDNDLVPVNEFIEKPVDPKALVAKVAELLG